jgi:nucleotide-binding universal stress UspA family protein
MNLKTILVPLDGSIMAEGALSAAVDLARKEGARLVLLRAAEAHTLPTTDPVEAQVRVMREAEEYLAGARERVRASGVAEVDVVAWYGPPAESILEAVRSREVDLIVMTSRARSGMGHLVLGSVAIRVLREANVPLLLIGPADARQDTPFTAVPRAEEISRV